MKIVPSLLETWLLKYQNVPYNLGESGVTNLSVGELMSQTGCSPEDLYQREQCDFVRSGFNSQLNGLILNKNQFFVAIAVLNT